ncbi:hypothetical protein KC19_1G284800 [Ceratodon purpureus]|uniref:Reverse transcriptase zinc-binding domain-containing protein n=1 Tax=Ceratodon purpureus TaxID=3225 RepID=A0A8T0JAC2_CERPU|nr:hypothetical protein KC19_1G284800 [Ceratodon purpureus]
MHAKEILRQPLFGNDLILQPNGKSYGPENRSNYTTWAKHGVFTIKDLWDLEEQDWKSEWKLQHQTHSRLIPIQRPAIIASIPWQIQPSHVQSGEWIALELQQQIEHIYHLTEEREGQWFGRRYLKTASEELILDEEGEVRVPAGTPEQVRVLISCGIRQEIKRYNPKMTPSPNEQIWMFGTVPIIRLAWDPTEWEWAAIGSLKATGFFGYETKRGYKIGLRTRPSTMRGIRHLRAQGYNYKQCKLVINKVWHSWLPKKISAMLWLTMAGGLPVGAWRHLAGWGGECKMCNTADIESPEHALRTCPMVAEVWIRYAALRAHYNLPNNCNTWNKILYGEITSPPGASTIEEATKWDSSGLTVTTENTAWDILRACLVWNIWVQKCAQELNGESFSVGKVLFYSWKTTIQIGMEVWAEIFRHAKHRSTERRAEMMAAFETIWTKQGVFGRMAQAPKWNSTPPDALLPQNLAQILIRDRDQPQLAPSYSPDRAAASSSAPSEDLSGAIDDLFAEVNLDLQQRENTFQNQDVEQTPRTESTEPPAQATAEPEEQDSIEEPLAEHQLPNSSAATATSAPTHQAQGITLRRYR